MNRTKRLISMLLSGMILCSACIGTGILPGMTASAAEVSNVMQPLPEETPADEPEDIAVSPEAFSAPEAGDDAALCAEDTPIFTSDCYDVSLNYSRDETATVTLTYGNIWPATGNVFIRGYHPNDGPADWYFGKEAGCSQDIEIYGKRNGSISLHFELIQESSDMVLTDLYIFVRVTGDSFDFYADTGQITLNKTREETEIIVLTYENLPDGVRSVYIHAAHGENRLTTWDLSGDWSENSFCIPISGWKNGTEVLTFSLVNADTDAVLAEVTVIVNVKGDTFAFYPSQNQIEIERVPNAGKTVRLNYENMPDYVDTFYMRVRHGDNPVTEVNWGDWVGHAADLYITPMRSGSERLTVYLCNSATDLAIAETYIDVRVRGEELEFYASVSEAAIDRSRSETQTIYLTYENLPEDIGSVYIHAAHGDVRKTEWNWGSWAGTSHDITFSGLEDGTETVIFTLTASETGKALASCAVTLTVTSSQVQFYSSADAVYLNGTQPETIYLTFGNVPENVKNVSVQSMSASYQTFDYGWGEWSGATVPVTLTGKQDGTDFFTLTLRDGDTDEVLSSLWIPVTVTGNGEQDLTGSGFVWGRDNWNFYNRSPDCFGDSRYRDQISEPYLSLLADHLTNTEYTEVFKGYYYNGSWYEPWLNEQFGGSCYGMSSLIHLSLNGYLDYAQWDPAARCIHDFRCPVNDMKLSSLITYYQMLQIKDATQNLIRSIKIRSHEQNIKAILSELEQNDTALICFQQPDWGGHAILAIGAETGSFYRPENGETYQGRIRICDPNSSARQTDDCDIYYKTDTYEWMIPLYYRGGVASVFGARINYIGTDVSVINNGGLLEAPAYQAAEAEHLAKLEMAAVSESHYIAKIKRSASGITNIAMSGNDIITDESFRLRGIGEGTAGYLLRDPDAAYKVHQNIAEPLKATMDYDAASLSVSADAASEAVFDGSGYVAFSGDAGDYCFGMTFDETYPTDWFFIGVSGEGAKKASLEQVEKGYILSADKMQNVRISAMNRTDAAEAEFSGDYASVLIYEIDPLTIGIAADTDGDGTYEKQIGQSDVLMGDLNGDRQLTVSDAVLMQHLLSENDAFRASNTSSARFADMDGDGILTLLDMRQLLKKLTQ